MTPPPAIRRFEILWWGSTAVWMGATALAWRRTAYQLLRNPATAPGAALAQPITVALVLLVTVAIAWPVRRGSGGARWAALVVAVLSGLFAIAKVIGGLSVGMPAPVTTTVFLLSTVLGIAAVAQLFTVGAAGWFGALEDGLDEEVID